MHDKARSELCENALSLAEIRHTASLSEQKTTAIKGEIRQMKFKLKNRDCEHFDGIEFDGVNVDASPWVPGCQLPGWCAYKVDPQSMPGKLMIIDPDGKEAIAYKGDVLINCRNGILAIDPDEFFSVYKEA